MTSPTLLKIDEVAVADVIERGRLRPVSEAAVESLVASIGELGVMKDPIHVRKLKDGKLVLIAGGHRLAAARRLGWERIAAKVWTNVTDDWARLMEVDDNIAGAELNALDTAIFLATRKEVYERLHPETKAGVAGGRARQGSANDIVSFAAATAEKFALSRRQVERLVAAGAKLDPKDRSLLRAAKRPVTLKDLTEISKIGQPPERYAVVAALSEGRARTAAEARKAYAAQERGVEPPVKDPVEEGFNKLMDAWKRAPKAARRRFIEELFDEVAPLVDDEADHRVGGMAAE
ncbi:ParB/RepB/Spo0J family partition protein [Acidimangrovimonas sediminis]|uniref:ParB/RepB/Spo0J family partition protein n=1 Tax=Acidimangrovimonas sediminis TaxID=2056283 RepID=UPI000C7FEF13|nr:ParB/RepB/Spo0J family partition protein [Acidimangrovimonas sediminis]